MYGRPKQLEILSNEVFALKTRIMNFEATIRAKDMVIQRLNRIIDELKADMQRLELDLIQKGKIEYIKGTKLVK